MIESRVRPYFFQPDKLLPFLSFKKQEWPSEFTREYFLSFEDALWNLLPRLGYRLKSKFLLPDFYCFDVIQNILSHGYEVKYYHVEKDLTVDAEKVATIILKELPDIFVDFEAVGIANGISEKILRKLPFNTLVLQDKVHTVVGASIENYPTSNRHLLLTSTRKVSPFPGALAVYTRNARRNIYKNSRRYVFKALWLWAEFLFLLKLAVFFHSKRIAVYTEKILRAHDDLIGDEKNSAPLSPFLLQILDRFDIKKIEECKRSQYQIYENIIQLSSFNAKRVWGMPTAAEYSAKLRGFPIIINEPAAQSFVNACRNKGLFPVSPMEDSLWAKKRKLFLLPLGPHLTRKNIEKIAKIAQEALTQALQYDTITA